MTTNTVRLRRVIRTLMPGGDLRYTSRFDDPNLPGAMTTTVTLRLAAFGLEPNVVQEGIPELLARLVEVEIRE